MSGTGRPSGAHEQVDDNRRAARGWSAYRCSGILEDALVLELLCSANLRRSNALTTTTQGVCRGGRHDFALSSLRIMVTKALNGGKSVCRITGRT